MDQLLELSTDQFVELVHCRARRKFVRGIRGKPLGLLKRLRKSKQGLADGVSAPPPPSPGPPSHYFLHTQEYTPTHAWSHRLYHTSIYHHILLCCIISYSACATVWSIYFRNLYLVVSRCGTLVHAHTSRSQTATVHPLHHITLSPTTLTHISHPPIARVSCTGEARDSQDTPAQHGDRPRDGRVGRRCLQRQDIQPGERDLDAVT